MINTNLPFILHLFRDIAFDRSKIAIFFSTPLRLNPPTEGFPGTISVKLSVDVNGWPSKVPNGVETLQKISTGWVGRTNVTDRRQTELRQHIANLNVSSRSLKTTSNLDLLDGRSIGFLFFYRSVALRLYGTVVYRKPVSDRRTFPVRRSICSWRVTTYVGKPSTIGQPTRPTQPFILSGSINSVVPVAPSGECPRG